MKCCLCDNKIKVARNGMYDDHNAQPLADGSCCSDCNVNYVLPSRNYSNWPLCLTTNAN